MRNLRFNFNNEVDSFEIVEMDDKTIHVPIPDGDDVVYDSLQQFAEFYAQARDVKPEFLKNWVLVENGNVVSFVLRAGTAGISAADAQDSLNQVLREFREEGTFHPLDVERVRQSLVGADDVMATLAASDRPQLAQALYDRLDELGVFAEPEPEEEEVDPRSDMERYLDVVLERDHTLSGIAAALNVSPDMEKAQILEYLESRHLTDPNWLRNLYEELLSNAMADGIHVDNRFDAILVVTQFAAYDASAGNRYKNSARMAGRDFLNVSKYTVGQRHIRKEGMILSLGDLNAVLFCMIGDQPTVVAFDPNVDAQLEEEEARRAEEEGYDEDEDYDYEDDYDEDYDEYE